MKRFLNILFLKFLVLASIVSCRTDDSPIREIDQTLQIFVDSAGIDMLNSNLPLAYESVSFNDINGLTDNTPVSFSTLKTTDTLSYLQYISGAKRILIDSSNLDRKLYQSKIALTFSKTTPNNALFTVNDTMIINYSFTPERFQIENVIYNNSQIFTKTIDGENIFTVQK